MICLVLIEAARLVAMLAIVAAFSLILVGLTPQP